MQYLLQNLLKYFPNFGYYLLGDLTTIFIKERVANKKTKNSKKMKTNQVKRTLHIGIMDNESPLQIMVIKHRVIPTGAI